MRNIFKPKSHKDLILDSIKDLVQDLLYHDRKDDEELGMDAIEDCISGKIITIDSMVDCFKQELLSQLKFHIPTENKNNI